MWVCSGSAMNAEIAAGSGLDVVLIDAEHSPNGQESILAQLQAVAAYPVAPLVRPPSATRGDQAVPRPRRAEPAHPMVDSAEQAAESCGRCAIRRGRARRGQRARAVVAVEPGARLLAAAASTARCSCRSSALRRRARRGDRGGRRRGRDPRRPGRPGRLDGLPRAAGSPRGRRGGTAGGSGGGRTARPSVSMPSPRMPRSAISPPARPSCWWAPTSRCSPGIRGTRRPLHRRDRPNRAAPSTEPSQGSRGPA